MPLSDGGPTCTRTWLTCCAGHASAALQSSLTETWSGIAAPTFATALRVASRLTPWYGPLATCGARTEDVPSGTAGCHVSRGLPRGRPDQLSRDDQHRHHAAARPLLRAARRPAVHPHVTVPASVLPSGRDASALATGRLLQVSSALI